MSGSLSDIAEPWGQLVRVECGRDADRFPFSTNEVTIGRAADCDLCFPSSKYLSSVHCRVVKDEGGRVFLKDTSTIGTLVDGKKLKRKEVQIQDGALIKLVSHRERPDDNIIYTFHDLRPEDCRPTFEEATVEYTSSLGEEEGEEESAGDGIRAERKTPKDERSGNVVPKIAGSVQSTVQTPTPSGERGSEETRGDGGSGSHAPPPEDDHMGENLICGICQEVFHNCISLQPCMHCYCAGCYSGWMARSNNCPVCRGAVERINHNHMINNLVESYLKLHPEKKRSDEDLKELDAKNKIDKDMLHPRKRRWPFGDSLDEGSTSEDSNDSVQVASIITIGASIFGATAHYVPAAPASLCRQCPGAMVTGIPTSSSSVTPPFYTCPPYGAHIMCQCCLEPMPIRGSDESGVPTQHCFVCQRSFCHLYWGCRKRACIGCLNKYKDMTIDSFHLDSIVLNNSFESRVLKDYLASQEKGVEEFFGECMDKLQDGTYFIHDHLGRPLTPDTIVCCNCAVKHLRELAFLYRKYIPDIELPSSVTGRPNCYYGKNCRTQSHNMGHASRYNHICEQTMFG